MSTSSERFTLRQLPLPAKLVVSVFLMSVGLGYFSALVQLHFKQADAGSFMPTAKNVIRAYHGELPEMRLVSVISGDPEGGWSSTNMTPAFFKKSEDWDKAEAETLRPQREAERQLLVAFLKAKAPKEAYDADEFPLVNGHEKITPDFKAKDGFGKVKTIIESRCVRCHGPGGEQEEHPLDSLANLSKYMSVEPVGRLSSDKLAQSTHAHLLSFSMLFALTGLVFAFTSYPLWFRCLLAPTVLMAQVADVSCWWLARIDGPLGELFALAILGTGGCVGLGLFLQITLSLFNMYGPGGKAILLAIFASGALGAFIGYTKFLGPYLEEEKKAAAAAAAPPQ
jgi:hypothetical protein